MDIQPVPNQPTSFNFPQRFFGKANPVKSDTGYPHDGRADNAAYRHDRRADKRRYPHDREIDIQMLKMFRNGFKTDTEYYTCRNFFTFLINKIVILLKLAYL